MIDALDHYREIWLADFEFRQPSGERPEPVCMVAREWRTGRTIRKWADRLVSMSRPPFPIGADSLFVAYYASAELGCFRALGWPAPARILDLFAEFRNMTNGASTVAGNSLLGALTYFGLGGIDAAEKHDMRELAQRPGPHNEAERAALLAYCETDVVALAKLLPVMLPKIDVPRALLRGRYMAAVAVMEWNGVPIDTITLDALRENWTAIKGRLIEKIDADYGVYVPTNRTLNPESRFGAELFRVAGNRDVDPYMLAEAAGDAWIDRRTSEREFFTAVVAARRVTGLTVKRISDWEEAGRDYASWPGLDDSARTLAGEYPALGIGRGYVQEAGYDDTNYAAKLWELLRSDRRPKPRHDPEILDQAADTVAEAGPSCRAERLTFSARRFAEFLFREGIPWPRLDSGGLALDDDTFRQMARTWPAVAPLRELRHSLGEMRLFSDLAVGTDGRNRCLLSPFQSITGRNQPSNARFIFGPSCWLRSLIQPEPGRAVAYVDWSQQEFGVAAALSGDKGMMDAYTSGDPYLTFAKQARAVPPDATKKSHPQEREQFKVCSLAVQYGMGPDALACSLDQPPAYARELLRLHRQTYPTFWQWSEGAVNHAMLRGWLQTVFGWRVHVGQRANPRSMANFPMQANGAEMLRLACCLATEREIAVCAPVHDALLVEGPTDGIQDVVAATQDAMAEASHVVLAGFELRSDAKIVRHPERYSDPRGEQMWKTVMGIMAELPQAELVELAETF
ncbi:MAG: DNA polymerase [Thermoguttaceae bacterium]